MGNTTNPTRWDARRRLEFIEQSAFWRGWIQRADLTEKFSLSLPQASADLQAYLAINPSGLEYDLNAKRYLGAPNMTLKISSADLGQAVQNFLETESKSAVSSDQVASIDLPYRTPAPAIARDLFRAVMRHLAVEIYYLSVSGNTETWRWISPHAFAHDGYRWHVRAFCHRDGSYKDFVLGRISKSRAPQSRGQPVPTDLDWQTWDTIKIQAHAKLSEIQKRAVEMDYDMKHGVVSLKVRRSMKNYTLAYLRLADASTFPQLLELAK